MLSLGIDTSNYTSSAAVIDGDTVLEDSRILLKVKPGERGLRQSDALYQHWTNLPEILEPLLRKYGERLDRVCVSVRPRPAEGSYMPVFNAGQSAAVLISASLGAERLECSHQEGHILAASLGNDVDFSDPVLCAHLSGGTLEIVLVRDGKIDIVSSSLDISYGQLIDRTGVAMGYAFPAGKYIDGLAVRNIDLLGRKHENPLCRAAVRENGLNLSGLETQVLKGLEIYSEEEIAFYLMERISQSFSLVMERAREKTGASSVLVSGGVASSTFLRKYCEKYSYIFGKPALCSDNAVGVARYGNSVL